jgi:hypothetical protein
VGCCVFAPMVSAFTAFFPERQARGRATYTVCRHLGVRQHVRRLTVSVFEWPVENAIGPRLLGRGKDLREVISAYQKCVASTVQRFGGFFAKYRGDGARLGLERGAETRLLELRPWHRDGPQKPTV